jgi:DNA polymerase III epsilon subunit-like protein
MKAAIFDTETTGLPKSRYKPIEDQPRIIEIGIACIDTSTYKVVDCMNELIYPGIPSPPDASKISKIFDKDVEGKPTFDKLYDRIMELFGGCEIATAHNFPFDMQMLSFEFKRIGKNDHYRMPEIQICTVQEYVPVFGYRPSLQVLYERIIGSKLAQTHRAIDDVNALIECLAKDKFFQKIGL